LIPILLAIFPTAMEAIHLISDNGSLKATFRPVTIILRYGSRSYGLAI